MVLVVVLSLHILTLPVFANTNSLETNNENQIENNDGEIAPLKAERINDHVEIVKLDWREIQRLLDQTGDVTFDGFGDKDAYNKHRSMEEAGISDTPGIENVSNKLLTTNEGETVMLYDLLEHRAVDPSEVPHLSQMVTTGYMSYTTLLDETTRVCPEYPDETCEMGHLNPQEAAEIEEKIREKEGVFSEISMNLPESPEELARYPFFELGEKLGVIDNASVYWEETEEELEELIRKLDRESPMNTIQSNRSKSWLQRADTSFLFPHHLVQFTDLLAGLRSGLFGDRNYAIVMGASAGVGIANVAASLTGAKLSSKGVNYIKDDLTEEQREKY